ncbi:nicotinamide riboside transporter PnuC [Flavobacterium azooxidireducens]|uniref:Nicotinamide riboside transporter PnuC n=1 Tax=Flavobacterium azooxidireducens TaxID=1871076 RepID=A0ABY4KIH1_9FLAO|nr:nicotinamide riboside transporter PnuC [Flavobacterium azooxidireducens]UPQ80175.1 nicotinamide riboside transporter PnuC [Flavobacterium azooxidireducens]
MIDLLFSQYKDYSNLHIFLEIIGVIFGLISVWCAKKDNILVFPTGIISTTIFIYLLWEWKLLGDFTINIYYSIMSVYGWYHWTRKKEGKTEFPIANITKNEKLWAIVIFVLTSIGVVLIYTFFDKFTSWTAYVDTFTTGVFFVGMWLMAKRKVEHWIFWIVGDIVSIPLYYYKGLTFTSLQYFIFTIIAFYGYIEWKKTLNNSLQKS